MNRRSLFGMLAGAFAASAALLKRKPTVISYDIAYDTAGNPYQAWKTYMKPFPVDAKTTEHIGTTIYVQMDPREIVDRNLLLRGS